MVIDPSTNRARRRVTTLTETSQCCSRLLYVCLSVCDVCIVAKRCVLGQKLPLRAYKKSYNNEESIDAKMNVLYLYLEVV